MEMSEKKNTCSRERTVANEDYVEAVIEFQLVHAAAFSLCRFNVRCILRVGKLCKGVVYLSVRVCMCERSGFCM